MAPCRGDRFTPDASGVGPGWGRRDFTSSRPRSHERLGRPAGACMSDGPTPDPPPARIAALVDAAGPYLELRDLRGWVRVGELGEGGAAAVVGRCGGAPDAQSVAGPSRDGN